MSDKPKGAEIKCHRCGKVGAKFSSNMRDRDICKCVLEIYPKTKVEDN